MTEAREQNPMTDLERLERALGIPHVEGGWLEQAFVHRSFVNELPETELPVQDNERLEFLGDAALGIVVSDVVFRRFPGYTEGELTRVRSLVVRRETLSELARKLRLGGFLRLGKGEDESGGRERPAILCATFEAVIGAVYLERGIGGVFDAVAPLLDDIFTRWTRESGFKDPKSRLQELAQSRYGVAPRYKVIDQSGPDHARKFVMQVQLLQQRVGVGVGMSKQEASQLAAQMALGRLGETMPDEDGHVRDLARQWSVPDDAISLLASQQ